MLSKQKFPFNFIFLLGLLTNVLSLNYSSEETNKVKRWTNDRTCGEKESAVPLIVGGEGFPRGEWPYMVAIFHLRNRNFNYICGGTLISRTEILTAAHCIHNKGQTRKRTQDIRLRLGAYNLYDIYENGFVSLAPSKIIVHEDWNPQLTNFDADIAMIFVEESIHFTRYIKPVCILPASVDIFRFDKGWTVGWGRSEDNSKLHEEIPKQLKVSIVSNEICFLRQRALVSLSSERTFCAGTETGAGVCLGDSGSGLFVSVKNKFYLAGIVSSSLVLEGNCDVKNLAIFTNAARMSHWIDATSSAKGGSFAQLFPISPSTQSPYVPPIYKGGNTVWQQNCGVMSVPSNLIQGGKRSFVKQWPFSVAVYKVNSLGGFGDYVTGTLISRNLVVSEPSILEYLNPDEAGVPNADDLKLILGVQDLDSISFPAETAYVDEIIIHPNYRSGFPIIVANIAVLVLKRPATLNEFTMPICLWDEPGDLQNYLGEQVFAVGFGSDNRGTPTADATKTKKHLPLYIVSQADCPIYYQYVLSTIPNRNAFFCATSGNNTKPCIGDSFTLYKKKNDRWFLFAVGSLQLINYEKRTCDENSLALYENIFVYENWLNQIIETYKVKL